MANNIADMMNKFSDMMGNSSNSTNQSNSSFDASKISPEMINNIAQMFNKSENNSSIDMDTILKLKGFMEQVNRRDTPDSNLLASLKPYLKESRKNKVDQYIGLLNMSKAMNLFGSFGGGNIK